MGYGLPLRKRWLLWSIVTEHSWGWSWFFATPVNARRQKPHCALHMTKWKCEFNSAQNSWLRPTPHCEKRSDNAKGWKDVSWELASRNRSGLVRTCTTASGSG